jgi:hypothetical protein
MLATGRSAKGSRGSERKTPRKRRGESEASAPETSKATGARAVRLNLIKDWRTLERPSILRKVVSLELVAPNNS